MHPNSSTRIADFVVLQLLEGQNSEADDLTSPCDVNSASVRLKTQDHRRNKAFASRGLKRDAFKVQVGGAIEVAINDALIQAALLFEKFERLYSVITIAASGNYWRYTWTTIQNKNFSKLERLSIDAEYKKNYVSAEWSPAYPLDDEAPEETPKIDKFRA